LSFIIEEHGYSRGTLGLVLAIRKRCCSKTGMFLFLMAKPDPEEDS